MTRRTTKLLRENDYLAEVEVELEDDPDGWGPYLSLQDVRKLDAVAVALRAGDLRAAQALARVYHLTPTHVEV